MKWTENKLRTKIKAQIKEELRAEGLDPDVRPTDAWLREHGYSGIYGFADRNEMTVVEVLEEICGFEPRPSKPLGVKHPESRRLLEEWLETEENLFYQWGENRVNDAKTHIRTLAEVADETLGSTNLLRVVRTDPSEQSRMLLRLFSGLAQRLESQGAQSNYTRTLERWADHLALMEEIEDHKVGEMRGMMGYSYERRSPEHELETKQVRAIWRAAEGSLEDRALLVMLALSGMRSKEPTDIKINELRLDRIDPYVVFDEDRKTGAATVPIMAGVEVIEAWIEQLEQKDWWDHKWLFPSKRSKDGSRSSEWVNDRIEELVKRAGVTFPDGEEPTPKHFRSFWYSHYVRVRQDWLIQVKEAADEQGVESERIVDLHYLTDKLERHHFRRFAESCFAAVFGEEMVHGFDAAVAARKKDRDETMQAALDDFKGTIREQLKEATDEHDDIEHESGLASDPLSAWTRSRLQYEYKSVKTSPVADASPPLRRVAVSAIAGVGAATFLGTFFAFNGFLEELLSADPQATAAFVTAIVVTLPWMIYDIHETHHKNPQSVEPETQFDRLILWIHSCVAPAATTYCSVRDGVVSVLPSVRGGSTR